jgi:hypothetical protein
MSWIKGISKEKSVSNTGIEFGHLRRGHIRLLASIDRAGAIRGENIRAVSAVRIVEPKSCTYEAKFDIPLPAIKPG